MSIRVPYETVKSTVTQAFLNLGLSQEKAEKCAEIHTESSLEGIESHGLNRLPSMSRRAGSTSMRSPSWSVQRALLKTMTATWALAL